MKESELAAEEAAWNENRLTGTDEAEETEATAESEVEAQPEPEETDAEETDEGPPPEAEDEAEPELPAEATDTEAPEGEPPAEEPAKAQAAPTDQPKTERPKLEPFAPRIDGRELKIPGAFVSNGHVIMSTDVFQQHVRPKLVADRQALKRQWTEEGRQKGASGAAESHPDVQYARAVLRQVEDLKKAGPDGVFEWANKFLDKLPVLEAKAEANTWRARAEQQTETEKTRQSETEQAERDQVRESSLRHHLGRRFEHPEIQPLGLDADRIYERLRWDRRLFRVAEQDYPDHGVREGQEFLNLDLLDQVLLDEAKTARQMAGRRAEAQKKVAENRATLDKNGKKPAPVVASSGAGQGVATKDEKLPTNLEEWEDWVMPK